MRGLNLDHLQTLAHVVEQGSFSAAAERLGLTQPAVSMQVRALERRLGVRLLERTGRRAAPTPAGLELLRHAQRIDAAVAGALEALADHAAGTHGRVRLGTGETACIYLLPPVLRALRARFPGLEIVVSTGNSPAILKALEENTLDVALVTLPAPGRMFQVSSVQREELVAIFPAEGLAVPRHATPAALAALPMVVYEPRANFRHIVDDWFRRAGQSLKPVMELGSVEAIKELVGAGLGCAILPRIAVSDAARSARLVLRSLEPALHRRLGVVLRHDKPLNPGLREVVRALAGLGRARPA